MMLRTYYTVVTQYDCDPAEHPPGYGSGARGPLVAETYLDEPHTCRHMAEEAAHRMPAHYGWARVAVIVVDIPDEETVAPCV